jgi:prepilin-type processing-associated H-X9-DG protein
LIELLVVLVLLIVLTTMYWGFGSASNQRRQKTACQQNLQKIYVAMEIYAKDSGGPFPVTAGAQTSEEALDVLVPRYTVDTAVFICPGGKDSLLPAGESFRNRKISYAYYMGRRSTDPQESLMSDRQIDTRSKTAGQYAFSATGQPPGNNHQEDGGNILFCDGHVEPSPARVTVSLVLSQGVVLLNPKP